MILDHTVRRESYLCSGVLHLAVAALAVFGLPTLMKEPPAIETPIVVDLVPIGAKSNPPPKQSEQIQPEPSKAEPAKAEPPKPEPPKPEPKPEPAKPPPPPPPQPESRPPEPDPIALPKPEAKPQPKPEPPKPEPKPQPQTPEQKLSDLKPPPKPVKPQDELDSLLKSVDKAKPKSNPLDDLLKATDKAKPNTTASADKGTQAKPQSVRGSDMHNPNEPISMTEADAIRAHVSKFWNIPAGAKDADKLVVEIRVSVMPDGTVTDARIVNAPMLTDSFWTAAAESARRAVRLASPLPIPKDKYDQFKDFVIAFNPKQMVMGR